MLGDRSWPQYPSDGFTLFDCSVKKLDLRKECQLEHLNNRLEDSQE